jgi:hypothetical protein
MLITLNSKPMLENKSLALVPCGMFIGGISGKP